MSAGMAVAACLAFAQTVHTQRAGDPAAAARAASSPHPAGTAAIVPFKIQVPNAVLTDL
jgi:hypothetical protein